MSKKGKHGVRNPKKSKPNPYAKRRNRGGWGNEPREDEWQQGNRWSRNGDYDDTPFEDSPEFDDSDIPWNGDDDGDDDNG